jgi:hypothetical protein
VRRRQNLDDLGIVMVEHRHAVRPSHG